MAPSSPLRYSPETPAAGTSVSSVAVNRKKAFLRQRSSSLPRILPPIYDGGGAGGGGAGNQISKALTFRSPHRAKFIYYTYTYIA